MRHKDENVMRRFIDSVTLPHESSTKESLRKNFLKFDTPERALAEFMQDEMLRLLRYDEETPQDRVQAEKEIRLLADRLFSVPMNREHLIAHMFLRAMEFLQFKRQVESDISLIISSCAKYKGWGWTKSEVAIQHIGQCLEATIEAAGKFDLDLATEASSIRAKMLISRN